MGKRSNFKRLERDFYPTPKEAVIPLLSLLPKKFIYAEPCCGKFDLVDHLDLHGGICFYHADINEGFDALELETETVKDCDYIITNPPWTRSILHPLITHFSRVVKKPTWLLIDAPWMFTKQAEPYLRYCSDIVTVGRVKWIPDSKFTSKDDCCWYKFIENETDYTKFWGKDSYGRN